MLGSVTVGLYGKSPANEDLEMAKKAYDENDFEKALRYLIFGFEKDNANKLLYDLTMKCLDELGAEDEVELFNNAIKNFKDGSEFYNLGYYYVSNGSYRLAIPFLQRANKLLPQDNDIALELAIALTAHYRPREAQEILEKLEDAGEFWVAYQYLWCSLLLNKRKGIKEFIAFAEKQFNADQGQDEDEIEEYTIALDKLQQCYDRLCLMDNLKNKPQSPIQQWQFVQYGGAILDYFEETTVAGGRYVALVGQYSRVHLILKKLVSMLDGLNRKPLMVISLEDRNSVILGKTLSRMLNVEFQLIDEENIGYNDGLIVASSANEFCYCEDIDFSGITKNQTVFAFNLNWLSDCCTAPDIAGMMTQSYFFPWESIGVNFNVDSEEGENPQPEKGDDEIVNEILSEKVEIGEEFKEILKFYLEVKDYLKGGEQAGKKRLPFNTDSPVEGAYFC